jgi:hypothetical protein
MGFPMILGEQLRALLLADPAIVAIVVGRIFPGKLPQGVAVPALRYTVVSDVPQNSLQGFTSGLHRTRVQIDAYGKRYLDAQGLAKAVTGAVGSLTGQGLRSLPLGQRDGYEDETELHRVSMDFSMWVED